MTLQYNHHRRVLIVALAALTLLWACSGGDLLSSKTGGDYEPEYDTGSSGSSSSSSSSGMTTPPPEVELELRAPEAAKDFVFVASTSLDAVARIRASDLEIEVVEVGSEPTQIRTRSTINTAAVLNFGSSDVSIVHADPASDATTTARVAIDPFLNELTMSPDGAYALAYFEEALIEAGDPAGSFQVVSLVHTIAGAEASVTLPVSFHVQSIQFDSNSERAFVVTDDFIHPIDLAAVIADAEAFDPGDRVALSDDVLSNAADREVVITADGHFAVVRSLSDALLRLIDLTTGESTDIILSGIPTDLDLTPGGDGALVVVRETQELVIVPLPESFTDPSLVEVVQAPDTIPVGQALMAPDGRHAILFSTVGGVSTLGDFNLEDLSLTAHRLGSGKAIQGAVLDAFGRWVFILHHGDSTSDDPTAQSEGFSVVRFGTFEAEVAAPLDKFFQSDARTSTAIFTEDGAHLYALVPETHHVIEVDLLSLHHRVESTGSPPRVIGEMPSASRVYISQQHAVGRISFIDVLSGAIQTVTGFELNSRIR